MDNEQRYSRQLSLAEIGPKGQAKLRDSKVAIIGCGGLGAIAAAYLAGAGVGALTLIDGDTPALSNLHRQVFFSTDESRDKATALAAHLRALNPEIETNPFPQFLRKSNIQQYLEEDVDLVLECTDQAGIKHMVSDYCALHELPLVYGAVHKTQGYLALFPNQLPSDSHLRDLFPEPDNRLPTCAEVGVLNTAAGIIGLFQANEALKFLLGLQGSLANRLLTYDCLKLEQRIIKLGKTFQGDLEKIWRDTDYHPVEDKGLFLVTKEELAAWPADEYQLISLLNEQQEPKMPPGVVRYGKDVLQQGPAKKVFYCQRGRQSKAVAALLRKKGIEAYWLNG